MAPADQTLASPTQAEAEGLALGVGNHGGQDGQNVRQQFLCPQRERDVINGY